MPVPGQYEEQSPEAKARFKEMFGDCPSIEEMTTPIQEEISDLQKQLNALKATRKQEVQ